MERNTAPTSNALPGTHSDTEIERKRVVLVDIEAMYYCDEEALRRFKEISGSKEKSPLQMTEYPINANFCATQSKIMESVLLKVSTHCITLTHHLMLSISFPVAYLTRKVSILRYLPARAQ